MYKAQQDPLVGTLSIAQGHCSQEGVIRETHSVLGQVS